MDDRIKTITAQKRRIEAKQAELAEKAVALEAKLIEAFGEAGIYGVSSSVLLEEWQPDGYTYGWLAYGFGRLRVGHRTSEDDLADAHSGTPEDERSNSFTPQAECSPKWLVRLLDETTLASLLDNIVGDLTQEEERLDGSLSALRANLASESAKLDAAMAQSLEQTGDETLKGLWCEAVDATHTHTAYGLTRSSRFLESVCATILHEREVELPKDKSMSPLVKACIKSLEWPSDETAVEDVRQLTGGVASICGGIGSLRTHFGTAHEASSHLPPLEASYATFAKNATAAVAIFLISRHMAVAKAPPGGETVDDRS